MFIRKRKWFLQFIIALLIIFFVKQNNNSIDNMFDIYPFLSALAPLLVITGIDEMARIYDGSLCEIELTTRYPLKVILLIRMAIMATVDIIIMIGVGLYMQNYSDKDLLSVLLYILVPFQISCIGLLKIIKYVKGMYLNYACSIYCLVLVLAPYFYNLYSDTIYNAKHLLYWCLAWIGGVVIITIQVYRLSRQWEGDFKNEIGS